MNDWCPENDGAYRAEMAAMYPVQNRKRIEELEAALRKCVGALGDISNGEPEWPNDPQKELDWCRNRATAALIALEENK